LFVLIFTNIARKVLLTGSLQSLANIYHYSSTSKPRKYKKQNGFIPIDLVGTWVNTKVDSLSSNHSLSEIFKPVSGFTIKNDSAGNRKIVILYYGEQFAKWAFDSIYINADSILGQINGENKFIGMLNKDEIHISQLSLIDYSVYYDSSFNQKAPKTEFKKISSCSADCMFEQFIIEKTFNLFPIDIEYNSKKFNLTTARKNCDCNQTLFGFPYYTSYQIVNYKIDTSKNSVLRLALFNSQENRNDFFDLTISKTRNLLIKVD
ncbi:MAG TPA: hypothetical protein VK588_04715, partial [Chitinophagaceae bacterium]|nr:hypothetical protein [Chitinophagaceae bacterium]